MAIATLSIDIVAKLANVEQGMNRLANVAQNGAAHVGAAVKGILGPLAATISVAEGLMKVISSQREFDVLNAGLQTATGSLEGAGQAFEALQGFAAKTPYDLKQVTEGFTKLVNLGLTPSEKALTSYGNTASAMGKDLNQMIEAVADAATGEFERLKEFGIKASAEGDKVAFTFRGVSKTVGNNAKEIEAYLMSIGENEFGGAMQKRMDSLDGMLSNLGDEWERLFLNISQNGVGEVIKDGVKIAVDALGELNTMFASGEAGAYLDAFALKWQGWSGDAQHAIEEVSNFYQENLAQWEDEGGAVVDFLVGAFANLPENVRAFIGILTVEVVAGFDRISAYATAFKDGVAAIFSDDTLDDVGARLKASLESVDGARFESIDGILKERDAALSSADAQIGKARELRAEYDKSHSAQAAGVDALAKYKIAATGQLNAAQTKMMEEFRLKEQKSTLSATEFSIKEAEREAAKKREIAGGNAGLLQSIETELQAKLATIQSQSDRDQISGEAAVTRAILGEVAQRVGIEKSAANQVAAVWSQANAVKAAKTGGVIMNQGTPGEFVSSWDANNNYVGDLGTTVGFAIGGSFLVGGNGGTDSQLVSFRASPDERVTIETPEQQRSGRGGVTIENINVTGMSNARQFVTELQAMLRTNPKLLEVSSARPG